MLDMWEWLTLNQAVTALLKAEGNNGQITSVFNKLYLFAHLKRYCLNIFGVKRVSNSSSSKKWNACYAQYAISVSRAEVLKYKKKVRFVL